MTTEITLIVTAIAWNIIVGYWLVAIFRREVRAENIARLKSTVFFDATSDKLRIELLTDHVNTLETAMITKNERIQQYENEINWLKRGVSRETIAAIRLESAEIPVEDPLLRAHNILDKCVSETWSKIPQEISHILFHARTYIGKQYADSLSGKN